MRKIVIGVLGAVLVASACGGLFGLLITDRGHTVYTWSPLYPVFQQIAQQWSFDAAQFGSLYSCILLFFVGGAVIYIGMRDPSAKVLRGWFVVFLSVVLGVVIANLSGALYSPICGIPRCPTYAFEPPVWQFAQAHVLLSLALVILSTLIEIVGISLRRGVRGATVARGAQILQVLPVLTLTGIGLLALFLFYDPYVLIRY